MPKRFYVYVHMDGTGKPIYVGKGTGSRFMEHMEREEFAQHQEIRSVVHYLPSEAAALAMEQHLVETIGLADLINKKMPKLPDKYVHVIRETWDEDMKRFVSKRCLDEQTTEANRDIRNMMHGASNNVWAFYRQLNRWDGEYAMERRGTTWNSGDTKAYKAWGWIFHLRKHVRPMLKKMRGVERWICDILYCQRMRVMRNKSTDYEYRVESARKQIKARLRFLLDHAHEMQPSELAHRMANMATLRTNPANPWSAEEPSFILRACIDDELRRDWRRAVRIAKLYDAPAIAYYLWDLFRSPVVRSAATEQNPNAV